MPTFGRNTTWKVDHALNDIGKTYAENDTDSFSNYVDKTDTSPIIDVSNQLETPEQKKARKRSHMVAYTTMFVMSIGFSIVLSGVWPYLKLLDGSVDKTALGWVVAANPFGQMLASPLLGIWGNKAGSIRGACIASIIFFIGGNVMYASLYAFVDSGENVAYYMMIVARFIVGVSSANVTLCRSYLAGSTTLQERTTGIAVIAAAQALGFVVGPAIQAVLTVLVPGSTSAANMPGLVWDKYTATGWVAAALGFINLVIMLPCIFQEYNIAEKERALIKSGGNSEKPIKLPKTDYIGIGGILFAFFFVLFIFVLLETLAVPFVTDQYGIDDTTGMIVVGIALSIGGIICIIMFVITTKLAKKYAERKLLVIMGMVPTVIGTCLYLPFGNAQIDMQTCVNVTDDLPDTTTPVSLFSQGHYIANANINSNFESEVLDNYREQYDWFYSSLLREINDEGLNCTLLGCPIEQTWCNDVPQLNLYQLLVAFAITMIGYPVVQALSQSIFSKMLGPKPQGLWMGILTGVGSLSRITGPIFVSYIYTDYGTYMTFGIVAGGMFLGLVELVVLNKRLVPMKIPKVTGGYDKEIAEERV